MAIQNGWVKLHRKITEWEWYQDQNVFRVFLHLLLTANHDDKKWQGKLVKRGQKITSYSHLAHDTGLSVRSVRTAISKLSATGEVTYSNERKYSLITINNWDSYQASDKQNDTQIDKVATSERQGSDNKQELKELKNDKKVRNYGEFSNVKLSEKEFETLCDLIGENNTLSLIEEMSDYLASSGKRYKSHYAALRNWARRKIQDYQKGKGNQIAEI